MIEILRSLTHHSIVVLKTPAEIDRNSIENKTIFLFTTNEIYSSMNKRIFPISSCYLLGEDQSDTNRHFNNLKDLIFELSDELSHCYLWEMEKDLESGNKLQSDEKKEIAKQIPYQLKKLYRTQPNLFLENRPTNFSTKTTLIWLKHNNQNNQSIQFIRDKLKSIVTSFEIFSNLGDWHLHMLTNEIESSVFLIIDDQYQENDVAAVQQFNNIKHCYRFISKNSETFFLEILHRLIEHFNQLSNHFNERNDSNSSKEMLKKTRQLCETILTLL